jgi:hypothetical protein
MKVIRTESVAADVLSGTFEHRNSEYESIPTTSSWWSFNRHTSVLFIWIEISKQSMLWRPLFAGPQNQLPGRNVWDLYSCELHLKMYRSSILHIHGALP